MFLVAIPNNVVAIIFAMRLCGAIALVLAVVVAIRTVSLHTSLPISKAQEFIRDSERVMPEEVLPLEELEPEPTPGPGPKKPLVVYSLSPDAMELLRKLSVMPNEDNGWKVTPQKEEA